MDCNHKYLAYIKLFNVNLINVMFVSTVHSGTIYLFHPENNSYYYIKDVDDIATIYSGCIPVILIPSIKGAIKPIALGYQDVIKKLTYILDSADVQYLRRYSDNNNMLYQKPDILNANIIIALYLTPDTDYAYINLIISRFPGAIILACNAHNLISQYISLPPADNHMIAFMHALNYIYSRNLKCDYVFKLYHHADFIINYETLRITLPKNDVIGYPAIKYDYLDNNYVYQIITENKICDNPRAGINKIYANIKTLASKFSLPAQINRKTKEWANISKKTNKSYIPSSIFIIKFNSIPFEIVDCYNNAITGLDEIYEKQNYINAINKILTVFEY